MKPGTRVRVVALGEAHPYAALRGRVGRFEKHYGETLVVAFERDDGATLRLGFTRSELEPVRGFEWL